MQSKLIQALAVGELSWQDYANCRGADADLFFPERGASTRKAKSICGACEVRGECLDYAIEMGEKFGIWGGRANGSDVGCVASVRSHNVGSASQVARGKSWVSTGRDRKIRPGRLDPGR